MRSLVPPSGKALTAAFPGQPVEVTGWKDLPSAGDLVLEASNEDDAKRAVSNRLRRIEQDKLWEDVEIINEKRRVEAEMESVRKEEERAAREKGLKGGQVAMAGAAAVEGMEGNAAVGAEGEVKELLLIVKADVSGTVEAVVGALEGIGNKEAKVKIISSAVGDVQESDVEMARAVQGALPDITLVRPSLTLPPTSLHRRLQRQGAILGPEIRLEASSPSDDPHLAHHLPTRRHYSLRHGRPTAQDVRNARARRGARAAAV